MLGWLCDEVWFLNLCDATGGDGAPACVLYCSRVLSTKYILVICAASSTTTTTTIRCLSPICCMYSMTYSNTYSLVYILAPPL